MTDQLLASPAFLVSFLLAVIVCLTGLLWLMIKLNEAPRLQPAYARVSRRNNHSG